MAIGFNINNDVICVSVLLSCMTIAVRLCGNLFWCKGRPWSAIALRCRALGVAIACAAGMRCFISERLLLLGSHRILPHLQNGFPGLVSLLKTVQ